VEEKKRGGEMWTRWDPHGGEAFATRDKVEKGLTSAAWVIRHAFFPPAPSMTGTTNNNGKENQ
jgi:hypothetical protein